MILHQKWSKKILVVKPWSKVIFTHKKDPQPKWLRVLKRRDINVLRTEVHDERL